MDNRMDAVSFEKTIRDVSISDDIVFEEMKKFTADKYDSADNFVPPTDEHIGHCGRLGTLVRRLRPAVMERFRLYVVKKFGY